MGSIANDSALAYARHHQLAVPLHYPDVKYANLIRSFSIEVESEKKPGGTEAHLELLILPQVSIPAWDSLEPIHTGKHLEVVTEESASPGLEFSYLFTTSALRALKWTQVLPGRSLCDPVAQCREFENMILEKRSTNLFAHHLPVTRSLHQNTENDTYVVPIQLDTEIEVSEWQSRQVQHLLQFASDGKPLFCNHRTRKILLLSPPLIPTLFEPVQYPDLLPFDMISSDCTMLSSDILVAESVIKVHEPPDYPVLHESSSSPPPLAPFQSNLRDRSLAKNAKLDEPIILPRTETDGITDGQVLKLLKDSFGTTGDSGGRQRAQELGEESIFDEELGMLLAGRASQLTKALEQERFQAADGLARMPVPVLDFSTPDPEWKEAIGSAVQASRWLWRSFLSEVKPPLTQKSADERHMKWNPFYRQVADLKETGVTVQDIVEWNHLFMESEPLDLFAPSRSKPLFLCEADDDEISYLQTQQKIPEPLGTVSPGSAQDYARLRNESAKHTQCVLPDTRGLWSTLRFRAAARRQTFTQPELNNQDQMSPNERVSSFDRTASTRSQSAFDEPNAISEGKRKRGEDPFKFTSLANDDSFWKSAHEEAVVIRQTTNGPGNILLSEKGKKGAETLVLKFMELRGHKQTGNERSFSERVEKEADTGVASIKKRASTPFPDFVPPDYECRMVVSLALGDVTRRIQSLWPTIEFIDRDYRRHNYLSRTPDQSVPRLVESSLAYEADIIISPATGMVVTDLAHVKEKAPSDPSQLISIREKVSKVALLYERLIVLVSEGAEAGEARSSLHSEDISTYADFARFAMSQDCCVVVEYVGAGQDELAKWAAALMRRHADEARLINHVLIGYETSWEEILRRAGMNIFAAQVTRKLLLDAHGDDGLSRFLRMRSGERIEMLKGYFGGQKVLQRVNVILDMPWQ